MTPLPFCRSDSHRFHTDLLKTAVQTADPTRVVAVHRPDRPKGRHLVIGAGKASTRMAEAVEAAYGPYEGPVITRYGYAGPCKGIEIIEGNPPNYYWGPAVEIRRLFSVSWRAFCRRCPRWVGMFSQAVLILFFAISVAHADTLQVSNDCFANATESCYLILDGPIDAGAPARVQSLWDSDGMEGYQVLLNSTGGSLEAGLKLGRMIREKGLHTVVGRAKFKTYDGWRRFDSVLDNAECQSACAYAFVGGVARRVPKAAKLGFHRVALPRGSNLQGQGGIAAGQVISAVLIGYLAEMGVDPRIFVAASNTPSNAMHFPSPEELTQFDLVTPQGYGPFDLRPVGNGIIAVSQRLDSTRPYDHINKLTAYCRNGQAHFWLTADQNWLQPTDKATGEVTARFGDRAMKAQSVRISSDASFSYIEVALDMSSFVALDAAVSLEVGYLVSRAEGGYYRAKVDLTAADREKLAAAFRFCI